MRKLAIAAAMAATLVSTQAFAEYPEKTILHLSHRSMKMAGQMPTVKIPSRKKRCR